MTSSTRAPPTGKRIGLLWRTSSSTTVTRTVAQGHRHEQRILGLCGIPPRRTRRDPSASWSIHQVRLRRRLLESLKAASPWTVVRKSSSQTAERYKPSAAVVLEPSSHGKSNKKAPRRRKPLKRLRHAGRFRGAVTSFSSSQPRPRSRWWQRRRREALPQPCRNRST